MGQKICTKCRTPKDTSEFSANRTKKDGLNYVCKMCQNELTKQHYQENRQKYLDKAVRRREQLLVFWAKYKDGKTCPYCGESDPACFDFHHLDSKDKRFEIADGIARGLAVETVLEEMKKCVLLCANCHRKHHAGRLAL